MTLPHNSLTNLLYQAQQQGIISEQQRNEILALNHDNSLASPTTETLDEAPRFVMSHLLFYFGGLLAIGAMSLFVTLGFSLFGSPAIIGICLCYAVAGGGLARYFFGKKLMIPYSLTLGFILCLVPLLVFAIQDTLGMWESKTNYQDYHVWISWQWIFMELATLAVGAVMVWRFRRSFLMLPIAVTLWYLSMDIAPMLNNGELDFDLRLNVSLWFGLLLIVLAVWVDVRQSRHPLAKRRGQDFAFWLYIVAVATFAGGLCGMYYDDGVIKIIYPVINIVLILMGVLLQRKVFVVFGAMGCMHFLGYLSYHLFVDSMIFPLILTLIGLAVIFLGVWWQRHQTWLYQKTIGYLPVNVQQVIRQLNSPS